MDRIVQLLTQTPAQLSLSLVVFDIILTAICANILARFYIRYGNSLSNRSHLAHNFLLISVTTALIITVVKSSLALSLGLVGALSIVRFRSAIKEPEELAYLFLSISLGLGFGANQHAVTLISFFLILGIIYLQKQTKKINSPQNLFLSINIPLRKKTANLNSIIYELKKTCTRVDLKRIDQTKSTLETSFYVEFVDSQGIDETINNLKSLSPSIEISLIDQSGIVV